MQEALILATKTEFLGIQSTALEIKKNKKKWFYLRILCAHNKYHLSGNMS